MKVDCFSKVSKCFSKPAATKLDEISLKPCKSHFGYIEIESESYHQQFGEQLSVEESVEAIEQPRQKNERIRVDCLQKFGKCFVKNGTRQ